MEAVHSSETLVTLYKTTQHHNTKTTIQAVCSFLLCYFLITYFVIFLGVRATQSIQSQHIMKFSSVLLTLVTSHHHLWVHVSG
jgi:ABC-type Na+ efflux pump permease subunit